MVEDDDTLALALNTFQCFVFLKLKKKPVIIYVDFERNVWRYQRGNQKTFQRWSENTMAKKRKIVQTMIYKVLHRKLTNEKRERTKN